MKCTTPMPPHIERILSKLTQKARTYQHSVQFIEGTNMMEATVASHTDPTIRRHVVIHASPQQPPTCCSYSKTNHGLPCYHGVAVICEKYGPVNIFQLVAERHLTAAWKKQYDGVDFIIPTEDKIEKARRLLNSGDNLNIPVALAPPRGRPEKEAGRRKKYWFERSPSRQRRRTYDCSYCSQEGHTARFCPLRQGTDQPKPSTSASQPQPSSSGAQKQPSSSATTDTLNAPLS